MGRESPHRAEMRLPRVTLFLETISHPGPRQLLVHKLDLLELSLVCHQCLN